MDQHHWGVEHPLPSRKQRIRDARKDNETGDIFAAPYTKSPTSQATAKSLKPERRMMLRDHVRLVVESAGAQGYARFQIADQLGLQQNEITSSVVALLKLGDLFETNRTVLSPRTKQKCAVLVARPWMEK
jgi:hypothetical protein